MIVGFGRARLEPPLPFEPQGQSARTQPVNELDPRLSVTICVIRDEHATIVLVGSDVLAHTHAFARKARSAIAAAVGCSPAGVLLNASHTHASLWPGSKRKVSGAHLGRWLPGEQSYLARLPVVYASAARDALASAVPARVAWGMGRVPGRIGVRRQRDGDGRIVIGWDREAEVDDTVSVLRFDDSTGRRLGTIVGFGCHPVVLGHQVPRASSDFVGPLRETVESIEGGLCLFLQGASGDVQPRESLFAERGPEEALGRRIGLEAVHAVADADPWPRRMASRPSGRWTPTRLYRSSRIQPRGSQVVASVSRTLRLPLGEAPTAGYLRAELRRLRMGRDALADEPGAPLNGLDLQIGWVLECLETMAAGRSPRSVGAEVWGARIGEGILIGVSAELFGGIGAQIASSPSTRPIFVAGCCNGVLGYVPTFEAFSQGGFEVETAHRVYGQPAAVAPDAGRRIHRSAATIIDVLD